MDIITEFKEGLGEGWNMYWSPLTGLIRKAKAIIGLTVSAQQVQA